MNALGQDRARQTTVTVSLVVCIVGSMYGAGVFGPPAVADAAGGALAADATLLAPGGPAFSIWSLVYLGLAVYTVWQWLPAQTGASRHRRTGWLAAASMLLNCAWLLTVRGDLLWLSVVVIVALVLVLGLVVARLADDPPGSRADAWITDGTFGLYTGWVAVATCANVTAVLVDAGVRPDRALAEAAALAVLAVVGVLALALARRTRGNVGIGLAMGWGLAWIAVGRLTDAPESTVVGAGALVVAVFALAVPAWVTSRTTRAARSAP